MNKLSKRNKMSKPFIPQYWLNYGLAQQKPKVANLQQKKDTNRTAADVERVVKAIEAAHIDIAPSYSDWMEVGFALASEFGESGRTFFHRVSHFYSSYNEEETDRKYSDFLRGKRGGITIGTFFHKARAAGVKISKTPRPQNGGMVEIVTDPDLLPCLPDEVFASLPPILANILASAGNADRDIILLGSMVTLSVCLDCVSGVYDDKIVRPNLYLFVVAVAGSGKGSLALCRKLVEPIHEAMREESQMMREKYEADMKAYAQAKCKGLPPQEPPQLMLVCPCNCSSSAFLANLAANHGQLLLFETEGDTLSQTMGTDYGNYSDALRKAFHHETVSKSRITDQVFLEVLNPRLSVVLSGTPG